MTNAEEEIEAAIAELTTLRGRWLVDKHNPLFATLNRTIDAQLALLGFASGLLTQGPTPGVAQGTVAVSLILARAINGTTASTAAFIEQVADRTTADGETTR